MTSWWCHNVPEEFPFHYSRLSLERIVTLLWACFEVLIDVLNVMSVVLYAYFSVLLWDFKSPALVFSLKEHRPSSPWFVSWSYTALVLATCYFYLTTANLFVFRLEMRCPDIFNLVQISWLSYLLLLFCFLFFFLSNLISRFYVLCDHVCMKIVMTNRGQNSS